MTRIQSILAWLALLVSTVCVSQTAVLAPEQGDTKYTATAGTAVLRKALVAKYQKENNLSCSSEQIIVSYGGKQVTYRTRANNVVDALNQINGLVAIKPEGSFFVYVNCAALLVRLRPDSRKIATDQDVVDWLLESEGVAVVAGVAYGLSPFFRLSFAVSDQAPQHASERIARAFSQLAVTAAVPA